MQRIPEIVLNSSLQIFNSSVARYSECAGKRDVVIFAAECGNLSKLQVPFRHHSAG